MRYAPRDILSAGPKASVNLLTQGIAREEGRNGVRANIVAPGFITAGLGERLLDSVIQEREREAIERAAALRRIGTAEEVAEVVVEGLREERFLILSHPEVLGYMQRKASDYDRWIGGMNRLQERLKAAQ